MKKKKVLILGASGMLGVEVLREFSKKNILLYATIRSQKEIKRIQTYFDYKIKNIKFIKFEIKRNYINNLKKVVKDKDYIINCIGIIKPYINENSFTSIEDAISVNSNFPHILNFNKNKNCKVYQIATDCVYDGFNGKYTEDHSHSARDIYGKTKSLGEVNDKNFFNIRCSIIGKEIKSFKSLICWFTNQKKNSTIYGFSNHKWNGITTRHFAKIVSTLVLKNISIPNLIHIVPQDILNKYQLLKIFQKKFNRGDLKIKKSTSNVAIDRTLSTKYYKINKIIHSIMKYKNLPKIKKLVEEII
tara:strand:- start:5040 stop:5945 length:906 start_codon:yes stop_codon:yes gene_type:complete